VDISREVEVEMIAEPERGEPMDGSCNRESSQQETIGGRRAKHSGDVGGVRRQKTRKISRGPGAPNLG